MDQVYGDKHGCMCADNDLHILPTGYCTRKLEDLGWGKGSAVSAEERTRDESALLGTLNFSHS